MIFSGNGSLTPSDLTPKRFLQDYWQKKPLLIRQAFPGFTPELDADDIAGLACDELAESRLVTGSYPEHDWALRYGPFSEQDFASLPQANWTLLVQDVEKHYPPLHSLLDEFSFLPSWRIDDLMVSVAGPGGSVGPHMDQYDVFLLQVEGSRRWQIAETFNPALLPDCELNVLQSFTPEQEWVLEPGDMLYLPPGVAHHGVALDQCMTWSVGTRAPSTADLLQSLGEWLAQNREEGQRYGDSGMLPPDRIGEIDANAIERFRHLLEKATSERSDFRSFLGSFLSSYRLAHEPASPEEQLDIQALGKALEQGATIQHHPWTRLAWLQSEPGAILFAAGEEFPCPADLAEKICTRPLKIGKDPALREQQLKLVCELINQGHLYLQF
jgi:50S ribosomal protein L16 3-hydroxylase